MKGILLALIVTGVVGCSDTAAPKVVTTGVNFVLDHTCINPGASSLGVEVSIDSIVRDSVVLMDHTPSDAVEATPGIHKVQAREYGSGYTWPTKRVTVVIRQITTDSLGC